MPDLTQPQKEALRAFVETLDPTTIESPEGDADPLRVLDSAIYLLGAVFAERYGLDFGDSGRGGVDAFSVQAGLAMLNVVTEIDDLDADGEWLG